MSVSVSFKIPNDEEVAKEALQQIKARIRFSYNRFRDRRKEWDEADRTVVAYVPETEIDAKRKVKRRDGNPQYTTIVLPYTYSVLMAAHTFWTSVFLGRAPIFQYQGLHGEAQSQVQAVEAMISYQVEQGQNIAPLFCWLYDVGKYGLGVLGSFWDQEVIGVTSVESIEGVDEEGNLVSELRAVTQQVVGYQGNRLYCVDPRDFYPDPRVSVSNYQQGEFAAVWRPVGWNRLQKLEKKGYVVNLEKLMSYTPYRAEENSYHDNRSGAVVPVLERPDLNVDERADLSEMFSFTSESGKKTPPAVVGIFDIEIEIIPKEWRMSEVEFPEKWCFTVSDDFKVLLAARPQGHLHGQFPLYPLQMEFDGHALSTRGIPEIVAPLQDTMDWLLNSHFYNVRASLNNIFVADPSRVYMNDLQDTGPGKVIRLKPHAYGQDIRQALTQIPVSDITAQNMVDLRLMLELGERITGINDQMMGVVPQSGRKTATEIRSSNTFGISRMKTVAEYFSATQFSSLAQHLLAHSQQYYSGEMKMRVAGSNALEAGQEFVSVSPEAIAGKYGFISVDGTLPIDRFAQANLWREIITSVARIPQLAAGYDVGRMLEWVASLSGVKNTQQFRLQAGNGEALADQARRGNVVPVPGSLPRQVSGVGPEA